MYVDSSADIEMAVKISVNAKTSRPSVCNAIETLLVHREIAESFLPEFADAVKPFNLEIRGDKEVCGIIECASEATEEDYATEFDDYIIAVHIVGSTDEAINHIERYSTGHSEAIITRSLKDVYKRQVVCRITNKEIAD